MFCFYFSTSEQNAENEKENAEPGLLKIVTLATMINRVKKLVKRHDETYDARMAARSTEPVLRETKNGLKYWSILEQINSSFLDKMGYYDSMTSDKVPNFALFKAVNALLPSSSASASVNPCPTLLSRIGSSHQLSPLITSSQPPSESKCQESATEGIKSPKSSFANIPSRFLGSPSLLGPVSQFIPDSIELVGSSVVSDTDSQQTKVIKPGWAVSTDDPVVVVDVNSNAVPQIKICDTSVSQSETSSMDYESSCTSESEDDALDRYYALRLREKSLTIDDMDGLFVPSDAASTLSGGQADQDILLSSNETITLQNAAAEAKILQQDSMDVDEVSRL